MRATFALLLPRPMENAVQKFAWQTHRVFATGISVRRLPPHISLKQTFEIGEDITDLSKLHGYFVEFARTVPSLTLSLSGLVAWDTLLVASVEETTELRHLHERLNRELMPLFGDVRADFDGESYQFHLTVASGGSAAQETYRAIVDYYAKSPPTMLSFSPFTVRELALFVYDEPQPGVWEYMTYETLPLTGGTTFLMKETNDANS